MVFVYILTLFFIEFRYVSLECFDFFLFDEDSSYEHVGRFAASFIVTVTSCVFQIALSVLLVVASSSVRADCAWKASKREVTCRGSWDLDDLKPFAKVAESARLFFRDNPLADEWNPLAKYCVDCFLSKIKRLYVTPVYEICE